MRLSLEKLHYKKNEEMLNGKLHFLCFVVRILHSSLERNKHFHKYPSSCSRNSNAYFPKRF